MSRAQRADFSCDLGEALAPSALKHPDLATQKADQNGTDHTFADAM
jgi:hypothetical protein